MRGPLNLKKTMVFSHQLAHASERASAGARGDLGIRARHAECGQSPY